MAVSPYLSVLTKLCWSMISEQFIPPMMFSYNTSFHRSIKTSPFFLTFGVHPNLPNQLRMPQYGSDLPTEILSRLQLIRNIARKNAQNASEEYKHSHDNNAENRDFHIGQLVLLDEHSFVGKNTKLSPKFSGPHLVKRIFGHNNVELLLDNGKLTTVHVNRLKIFHSNLHSRSQNGGGNDQNKQNFPVSASNRPNDEGNIVLDTDNSQQQAFPLPAARPTSVGNTSNNPGRLTRSQTKALGLVYNDRTNQYQNQSSTDIPREQTSSVVRKNHCPHTMDNIIIENNGSDPFLCETTGMLSAGMLSTIQQVKIRPNCIEVDDILYSSSEEAVTDEEEDFTENPYRILTPSTTPTPADPHDVEIVKYGAEASYSPSKQEIQCRKQEQQQFDKLLNRSPKVEIKTDPSKSGILGTIPKLPKSEQGSLYPSLPLDSSTLEETMYPNLGRAIDSYCAKTDDLINDLAHMRLHNDPPTSAKAQFSKMFKEKAIWPSIPNDSIILGTRRQHGIERALDGASRFLFGGTRQSDPTGLESFQYRHRVGEPPGESQRLSHESAYPRDAALSNSPRTTRDQDLLDPAADTLAETKVYLSPYTPQRIQSSPGTPSESTRIDARHDLSDPNLTARTGTDPTNLSRTYFQPGVYASQIEPSFALPGSAFSTPIPSESTGRLGPESTSRISNPQEYVDKPPRSRHLRLSERPTYLTFGNQGRLRPPTRAFSDLTDIQLSQWLEPPSARGYDPGTLRVLAQEWYTDANRFVAAAPEPTPEAVTIDIELCRRCDILWSEARKTGIILPGFNDKTDPGLHVPKHG